MKIFKFDPSRLIRNLSDTLQRYPVESLLTVALFLLATLAAADVQHASDLRLNTLFYPAFLFAALTLNRLFSSRLRPLYWAGIAFIPLLLCLDMSKDVYSALLPVSTAAGALILLAAEGGRDNERFARRTVGMLSSAATAAVFAVAIFLLFLAIFFSVSYIFNIFTEIRNEVTNHASIFIFELVMPLLWLDSLRRDAADDTSLSRAGETLLNYIITPALLIYTAILYAYFLKIALTWSLPKGGIAYMVFAFTMVVMAVGACRPMATKRYCELFFSRFSLWALPAVAMFWIGSLYRVGQYGLTEWRIYLLACGVIMTAALALFASRRTGRYLYVAISAAALLALLTYIPPLSAEHLALRSQSRRALKLGSELGLVTPDGQLDLSTLRNTGTKTTDSLLAKQYGELGEALRYVDNAGKLSRLGDLRSNDIHLLTAASIVTERVDTASTLYLAFYGRDIDISGYTLLSQYIRNSKKQGYTLHVDSNRRTLEIRFDDRTIRTIDYDEILRLQLARAGQSPSEAATYSWMESHQETMNTLDLGDFNVVFKNLTIDFTSGQPRISDLQPDFLLVRPDADNNGA